jgi:hypothetical protein
MENLNSKRYLEKISTQVMEQVRHLPIAPSAQFAQVPRDPEVEEDEERADPDQRLPQQVMDKMVHDEREFYADDRDQDGDADYANKRVALAPPPAASSASASGPLNANLSGSKAQPAGAPAASGALAASSVSAASAPDGSARAALHVDVPSDTAAPKAVFFGMVNATSGSDSGAWPAGSSRGSAAMADDADA